MKACIIPLVYLDFELRKDYIVANFCVNRGNPIIVCGGECYLAKKIADTKKQEEHKAEQEYMASLIYQVMNVTSSFTFLNGQETLPIPTAIDYHYAAPFAGTAFSSEVFRPPLA